MQTKKELRDEHKETSFQFLDPVYPCACDVKRRSRGGKGLHSEGAEVTFKADTFQVLA